MTKWKRINQSLVIALTVMVAGLTFAPASVKATEKSEYPCIKTVEGNKYCYTSETAFVKNAWQEIGGMTYWFGDDGIMAVNTIAGTKAKGIYYVGKDGARVTSNEMKLAVKFVLAHSNSKLSRKKRLKQCYKYLWKHYRYRASYGKPIVSNMAYFARDMFRRKSGNCYRYALAFTYIARALGYDTRVGFGKIVAYGGGMTTHGWAEVKIGRKWLVCDPNMQRNHPRINVYMVTHKKYRYRHTIKRRRTMTVSGGKVKWK